MCRNVVRRVGVFVTLGHVRLDPVRVLGMQALLASKSRTNIHNLGGARPSCHVECSRIFWEQTGKQLGAHCGSSQKRRFRKRVFVRQVGSASAMLSDVAGGLCMNPIDQQTVCFKGFGKLFVRMLCVPAALSS